MTLLAQKPKEPTPNALISALIANGGAPYLYGSAIPVRDLRGVKSHVFTNFVNRNTPVSFSLPFGYQFESTAAIGLPASSSAIASRGYRNPSGSPAASTRFARASYRGSRFGLSGLAQISDSTAASLLDSVPNLQPGTPGLPAPGPSPSAIPAIASPSLSWYVPGSSWFSTIGDVIYNAVTGKLTQDQQQVIASQESASLQKAGMSAQQAAQQAASDVSSTVASSGLNSAQADFLAWAEQYGPWIAGGLGALLLWRMVK